ncbi:hypothetical protein [Streptomyces resistomycificus]|nr:hypothetical protein [Streptomyces resistomycificus]
MSENTTELTPDGEAFHRFASRFFSDLQDAVDAEFEASLTEDDADA